MTKPIPLIVVPFNGHHIRVTADGPNGRPRFHHLDVTAAMYGGYDTTYDPYSDINDFPSFGEWEAKFEALDRDAHAALKALAQMVPPI
jgi:hypothetical protein